MSNYGCGQLSFPAANSPGCTTVRDSTVFLRHAQLGLVKIGHGSTATDNLSLIDLGGTAGAATSDVALYNGGFILRSNAGLLGSVATLNWGQAIRSHESWDTSRRNHVLYETPTLQGFTVQAAVAEDNYWDVALRYAGEFNGVRIAAGIGYSEDTEFNQPFQRLDQNGALCGQPAVAAPVPATALAIAAGPGRCDVTVSELKGSGSVLHVPTGLFATFAAGRREMEGSLFTPAAATIQSYTGPDMTFWYLSGGVARNFIGIGNTVLFAEYSEHKNGLEHAAFLGTAGGYTVNAGTSTRSEVQQWGLGITQYVDAAAMEVFATYKNFSLEANGFTGANVTLNEGSSGVHDISVFVVGTRISF